MLLGVFKKVTFPFLLIALLSGCEAPKPVCPDPLFDLDEAFEGTWAGAAVLADQTWRVNIHFAKNPETGCMDVRASFPEAGMFYFEPETFSSEGDTLTLKVPDINWQITASAHPPEGKLEGAWVHITQNLEAPFSLTKIAEKAPLFKTQDITFQSPDGAALAATIIFPDGEGPFPGVVWTHGSGPDTRRTASISGRAYLAASLGMASLIYDKRGAGDSTGEAPWELRNLVMDAKAAVETLRANPEILADRVGIGGASQGGWVAPALAGEDPGIAFVIVGSAPGITPAEQNIYSMESRFLPAIGPEKTAEATAALRQIYDYYRTGEGYEEVSALVTREENRDWAQNPVFQRLLFSGDGNIIEGIEAGSFQTLFFDPLPYWEKISVPVFTIWGSLDHNVPAFRSQEKIEGALQKNGNENVVSIIGEGGGHGIELKTPDDGNYYFYRLHPAYIPALISFIEWQVKE